MSAGLDVVHVLAPARVGGLESVVTSLTGGLAGRGHRVRAVTVVEPGTERVLAERLASRGVPTRRVVVPHRAYHTEVRRLGEVLREAAPDLVHTHGYRADVVAGGVCRWLGLPTVSTVHGFTGGDLKNRLYEWLQCRSLRGFGAVVAVAEPIRRALLDRGVPGSRVHLVRNAWTGTEPLLDREEARARLGLSPDAFVLGWVGRLSPEKGPHDFLAAVAGVEDTGGRGVEASVVGAGPLEEDVRRAARAMDGARRAVVHGFVPDAAAIYRAFDVFVLSSRTEGTPVSLFEAMAAGVPVVATRVGGVPDVVRHEREALLVPPGEPGRLSEAVSRLRGDEALGAALARRARRRLERQFAPEPWLARYEEIYRAVTRAS